MSPFPPGHGRATSPKAPSPSGGGAFALGPSASEKPYPSPFPSMGIQPVMNPPPSRRPQRRFASPATLAVAVLGAALALGAAGCATPIGIRSVRPAEAERLLTRNVLNSGEPSRWSAQFLSRLGLTGPFDKEPEAVLAQLHRGLGAIDEPQRLFALAELSFFHADRTEKREWFLASAVYAWAWLFPEDTAQAPGPFDPRLRLAMMLYGRALARGLVEDGHDRLDVASREVPLPFGRLAISSPADEFRFGPYRLESVVSLASVDVRGLRNRYYRGGIGAPVVARCQVADGVELDRWMQANPRVPLTLLMRVPDPRSALRSGSVRGEFELVDPEIVETLRIGEADVPVEADTSAAIGYSLEGAPIWDTEIAGFRRGDLSFGGRSATGSRLFMGHPYMPGRVPVVFVHGTASSPARWAELINELEGDPSLRGRLQYWFFQYNSGNPVASSAADLRDELREAVATLDPSGRDEALRSMVVIGHSQGGLLTKLTVVDSGDRFWDAVSDEPFEAADMKESTRTFLRRTQFVEPLPFVDRVVFVATPHGGSVLASNWLGRIARRFVRLPGSLVSISLDILRLQLREAARTAMAQMPTSIDNMSPNDPFLKTLRAMPVSDGVAAHSIIAVRGDGPAEEGSDGVVSYRSAHLDDVDSEAVVRSGHSMQGEPATIEEVRRILYLHLGIDGRPAPAMAIARGEGTP